MPVPSLAQKAALAHYSIYEDDIVEMGPPHGNVGVDYSGWSTPAKVIQRAIRRRIRARSTIQRIMRGLSARLRMYVGTMFPDSRHAVHRQSGDRRRPRLYHQVQPSYLWYNYPGPRNTPLVKKRASILRILREYTGRPVNMAWHCPF